MGAHEVVLATDRLVLRRLEPDDAPTVAAYRSDPEVARYQNWSAPYPEAMAAFLIDEVAGDPVGTPGWAQIGIEVAATGTLVGDVAICGLDNHTAKIGYTLAAAHWGFGYATEAVRAMCRHLADDLGFQRLVAQIEPGNQRSIRLAERLGFAFTEHLDDGCLGFERVTTRTVGP